MKELLITLVLVGFIGPTIASKNYSGYQVLRTEPLSASQVLPAEALLRTFDLWSRPRVGRSVDVMVNPEQEPTLRKALQQLLGQDPSTLIPDLGLVVEREREERIVAQHRDGGRVTPSFDRYLELDEILAYLDEVVASYPDLATLIDIGQSYEGRPLRVLKLSNGGDGKPAVFMDSAIHAREWIAPPVALYAIYQLTENYMENRAFLDVTDFFFLVVANPDGYAYTFSDDRFWRKSRSPNEGSVCMGTDLNRNFDWHWGEGGIPDACEWSYPGSMPWSEVEVKAIADFIVNTPSITIYLALHSYGQLLLYPWGDSAAIPPTEFELSNLGIVAVRSLEEVRGTHYDVGSFSVLLYYAYGTSQDWAYGEQNIALSYTLELPGGGFEGFDPPASDILPVVTETWEAIKVLAANAPTKRP